MGRSVIENVVANLAAYAIVSGLGGLLALLGVFSRRALARLPIFVLFRRLNLLCPRSPFQLVAPGFPAPDLQVGHQIDGLPSGVRVVGLLDALALSNLEQALKKAFPKKPFTVRMHDSIEDFSRPIITVGGASVNEVTASIITNSLLQRGVWVEYPLHIARIFDQTFRITTKPDGVVEDYGFLVFVANEWNSTTGCCLVFGVYPAGTWAAVRVLESPMRYKLLEHLTGRSTSYVWFRLLLDRLRLRRFSEIAQDWVVVVRSALSARAVYPGEPTILLAEPIPPISNESCGWDAAAQADFWSRAARSTGWTVVAGDEPVLSTNLILDHLGEYSFAGDKILDFGCGPGRLFKGFFRNGSPARVTAMDRDPEMLRRATAEFSSIPGSNEVGFHAFRGDGADLAFMQECEFDTVVCWTVLNHVIDDEECEQLLRALCRVAGRRLLICDPVCRPGDLPSTSAAFPSRRRHLTYYEEILASAGFTVHSSVRTFGSPTHPEARRAVILAERVEV